MYYRFTSSEITGDGFSRVSVFDVPLASQIISRVMKLAAGISKKAPNNI